jgi:hypothetical protein
MEGRSSSAMKTTDASPIQPSATLCGADGNTSPDTELAPVMVGLNALKAVFDVIHKITRLGDKDGKMNATDPVAHDRDRDSEKLRRFPCTTCSKAFTKSEHLHVRVCPSVGCIIY